eukprot:CAMPEP_0202440106 /NCGR_PEP_ID=MMETSP1345-20130828/36516_1 /ASSEMBLY_ACC=CAM_ASM_000843 /TAXON_ID=342563 /ORGANISM="Fabrea Fabrea salina" /LENGTH=406 /DNA_ID=CAMNT_0049054679 /DNA_START=239 /DNA_END=1459 /DNA_ORIENTATION=-
MQGLWQILKWVAESKVTQEEFSSLYKEWQHNYDLTDLLSIRSSNEVSEIFTFFLILEEEKLTQEELTLKLETMIAALNYNYNQQLLTEVLGKDCEGQQIGPVSQDWVTYSESIFWKLDEARKFHIEAEAAQFLVLTMLLPELKSLEPSLLRKHTYQLLQDMNHTNGLVSMRAWKNYLLYRGMKSSQDLANLEERLQHIFNIWKALKQRISRNELEDFQGCLDLCCPSEFLPSIWNQAILFNLQENTKVYKFLRFSGWLLGSTANISTKGQCFIQGTYIRSPKDFALYLMWNYLEMEGFYHTFAHTESAVLEDKRFKVFLDTVNSFDKLLDSLLFQIISGYRGNEIPKSPPSALLESRRSSVQLKSSTSTSLLNRKTSRLLPPNNPSRSKSPTTLQSYHNVINRFKK